MKIEINLDRLEQELTELEQMVRRAYPVDAQLDFNYWMSELVGDLRSAIIRGLTHEG